MKNAFNANKADFTGINGGNDLYLTAFSQINDITTPLTIVVFGNFANFFPKSNLQKTASERVAYNQGQEKICLVFPGHRFLMGFPAYSGKTNAMIITEFQ